MHKPFLEYLGFFSQSETKRIKSLRKCGGHNSVAANLTNNDILRGLLQKMLLLLSGHLLAASFKVMLMAELALVQTTRKYIRNVHLCVSGDNMPKLI